MKEQQLSARPAVQRILSFCMSLALAATFLPGGFAKPVQVSALGGVETWDLSVQGRIVIAGNSDKDYVITGTLENTEAWTNKQTSPDGLIHVMPGYKGTITLDGVRATTNMDKPAMIIYGQGDNASPGTQVNLIIAGTNYLHSGMHHTLVGNGADNYSKYAGLTVCSGVNLTISGTGLLEARADHKGGSNNGGGAGIGGGGGGINYPSVNGTGYIDHLGELQGGNIHIKSGTIIAAGAYHGAGIGGGIAEYNGHVVVSGGTITAIGGGHGAGIGGGCKNTNTGQFGSNVLYGTGSVLVIPPAKITATGGVPNTKYMVGNVREAVYIGDPKSPKLQIRTETNEPNANIYFDLSKFARIPASFESMGIDDVDVTRILVGHTDLAGVLNQTAMLTIPTPIYSDATSTDPAVEKFGKPFMPQSTTATNASITTPVMLPLLTRKLKMTKVEAIPLTEGYTTAQASDNAFTVKLEYTDPDPLENLKFGLAGDGADQFHDIRFFAADGTTALASPPTELRNGDTYVLRIPLMDGKSSNMYKASLKIDFFINPADLTLTFPIDQQVTMVDDDHEYIQVTANPTTFITNDPSSASTSLYPSITHPPAPHPAYDPANVVSQRIITKIKNYDDIPSTTVWDTLMVPTTSGPAVVGDFISFPTTLTDGDYYIHWRITSGLISGHSDDFPASGTALEHGAFGPYTIDRVPPAATLTVNNVTTTPQEFSTLTGIPIRVEFDKPMRPSSVDAGAFSIDPSRGAITGLAVVAGSDNKVFTATYTPAGPLYNGQEIKIKTKAGVSGTTLLDIAGNPAVASGEIVLRFVENDAVPTITLNNASEYTIDNPSFTVTYAPGNAGFNTDDVLYSDNTAATALTGNIASHFEVWNTTDNTQVTSGYTVNYSAATKTATVSFATPLANSKSYQIKALSGKVFNSLRNPNAEAASTFVIAMPQVTSVTASPTSVSHDGTQSVTITVTGVHLDKLPGGATTIDLQRTGGGATAQTVQATVQNSTTATWTGTLPDNQTNSAKTYTFTEQYSATSKKTVDVTVGVATPAVTGLTATPTTLPYSGGSVSLTMTGNMLYAADTLEIRSGSMAHTITVPYGTGAQTYTDPTAWTIPANTTTTAQTHTFTVWLKEAGGSFVQTQSATVTVAGKPEINSITYSPALTDEGGTVTLTINGVNLDQIGTGIGDTISITRTTPSPAIPLTATIVSDTQATLPGQTMPANITNATQNYIFTEQYSAGTKATVTVPVPPAIPTVTGITANPTALNYNGGNVALTITGNKLHGADIQVYRDGDTTGRPVTLSSDGTTGTINWIGVPANSSTNSITQRFEVKVKGPGGTFQSISPTPIFVEVAQRGEPEVSDLIPPATTVAYDQGGTVTLTAIGHNLDQYTLATSQPLAVTQSDSATSYVEVLPLTLSADNTRATVTPNLPVNNTTGPIVYTFLILPPSGGSLGGASPLYATITVLPPDAQITSLTRVEQGDYPYVGGNLTMTVTGTNLHGATDMELRSTTGGTTISMGGLLPTTGGVATIAAPVQAVAVNDGDATRTETYTVWIEKNGGWVDTGKTLTINVQGRPRVTGIAPASTTIAASGEAAPALTVTGVNLTHTVNGPNTPGGKILVTQTNPDGTTVTLYATVTGASTAVIAAPSIPDNTDNVSKTYTFQATAPVVSVPGISDFGLPQGAPAVIIREAATPVLVDPANPSGSALKANPTLIENDVEHGLAGKTTLTLTGRNLHNFTQLMVRCDDGRTFSINPSDPGVTINPSNTEVTIENITIPHNPNRADKVYTFTVYGSSVDQPTLTPFSQHQAQVTAEGAQPKILDITVSPEEHSSAGGTSIFTLTGRYLNNATTLTLVDSLGGTHTVPTAGIAGDGRQATVSITFSGNVGKRNDIHVLEGHIDGTGTGVSASVEVGDSIPFIESAKASPTSFTSEETKHGNGKSTITIRGGYMTKADSISIYDVVNRTTYQVQRLDDNENTYVVTLPSNEGVYVFNILLNDEDTGISVKVLVGKPPLGYSEDEVTEEEKEIGGGEEPVWQRPVTDKKWTGRGGGAKGGAWSGAWEYTSFDLLFHHARQAVQRNPENSIMTLQNAWCITQPQLNRAYTGARADQKDGKVNIYFDTTDEYNLDILQGRLIMDPTHAKFYSSHLYPMVFTSSEFTGGTKQLFQQKFDSQKLQVVRLSQIGEYFMTVEVAANLNMAGFDTDSLSLYRYIPETGAYEQLTDAAPFVDQQGLLHFSISGVGGDIIVAEKPLTRNGDAFQPGTFSLDSKASEQEESSQATHR